MGSQERREREAEATRDLILDAARHLFVRNGFEGTSMRAIARAIEYTPTAIYHHFKGKDELFAELCARDFRTLGSAFQRIGRVEDPVERIAHAGRAYVAFAAAYGARGHRVEGTDDFAPLLAASLERPGVDLIELPITYADDNRVLNEEIPELAQKV